MIENEVNYRTWLLVGKTEFPEFHLKFDELLFPYFKLPIALCLLLSIGLVFNAPTTKLRRVCILNSSLLAYFLVISFVLQVPIHNELNLRHETEKILELIENNIFYRFPAVLLMIVSNFYLLYTVLDEKKWSDRQSHDFF